MTRAQVHVGAIGRRVALSLGLVTLPGPRSRCSRHIAISADSTQAEARWVLTQHIVFFLLILALMVFGLSFLETEVLAGASLVGAVGSMVRIVRMYPRLPHVREDG